MFMVLKLRTLGVIYLFHLIHCKKIHEKKKKLKEKKIIKLKTSKTHHATDSDRSLGGLGSI